MGNPLASLEAGPGTFVLADAHGSRVRPWREAATRGVQRGPLITQGMTEAQMEERLYTPEFHGARPSIKSAVDRLVDTAPPIIKTSGLSKVTRLTKSFTDHFNLWRAIMGRPLLVGDMSEQVRRAFHMHTLPPNTVITEAIINRAARRHLRESENQVRAEQNRRVTKEAYFVGPGVR